jgi:signal transduction histidine kinase/ligand-binding sensor domain-containing protein
VQVEAADAGRLPLRVFDDRDGLPQNTVLSLAFDMQGYLWAATQDGAAVYNGVAWRVVPMPNRASSNYVRVVYPASDGSIWFGRQDGGVARLNGGHWTWFEVPAQFPHERVNSILETALPDGARRLWFGTYGAGIAILEAGKFRVMSTEAGLPDPRVWSLMEGLSPSGQKTVWVSTERGLAYLDGQRFVPFDAGGKLPSVSYSSLLQTLADSGETVLWAGSWGRGLARIDREGVRFFDLSSGFPANLVTSLIEVREQDGGRFVWAGSSGAGLLRISGDGKDVTAFDIHSGLPSNNVYTVLGPSKGPGAGALWIGMGGGGLASIRMGRWVSFDVVQGLPSNQVYAISEARDSSGQAEFWFGTNGGLARLRNGKFDVFDVKRGLPGNQITALQVWPSGPGGRLLIALNAEGVVVRDGESFRPFLDGGPLPSLRINALAGTGPGPEGPLLWAATDDKGLATLTKGTWSVIDTSGGLPHNSVLSICPIPEEDGSYSVWVGTRRGMARVHRGGVTVFTREDGLPNNEVRGLALVQRPAGGVRELWIGTTAGLARLSVDQRGARIQTVSSLSSPFLPNNVIQAVVQHPQGDVFVGTNRGIARLGFLRGSDRLDLKTYLTEDGLPGNAATYGSALIDSLGRVWMGTVRGAAVFDPAREWTVTGAQPLYIERLLVKGDPRDPSEATTFDSRENDLRFEFALLSMFRERETRYRTHLVGFESFPTPWNQEPNRTFTNLPAGPYTFRVWASDASGNITGPVEHTFRIRPAIWLTWWAMGIYACGALGLVLLFLRLRLAALRRQNSVLESRVAQRTRELRASERRALEANKAKSQFLANMSHELRTPLTAVIGYAELLSDDAREAGHIDQVEDLQKIRLSARHLLGLINDVLDLSKIEAGKMTVDLSDLDVETVVQEVGETTRSLGLKNGNELTMRIEAGIGKMRSDETKVRQALLNLGSNAAKFTRDGQITIDVAPEDHAGRPGIRFCVADTGIGMTPAERGRIFRPFVQADESTSRTYGGTGLGLTVTLRVCRLLGGTVEVQSRKGHGSTFKIWLPRESSPLAQPAGDEGDET